MMIDETRHYGVILKNDIRTHHKIHILDRELGRIEASVEPKIASRLCRGALMTYIPELHKGYHTLKAIDFIHVPFDLARHDVLFLHHLLELSFYFIPSSIKHDSIFDLLVVIYRLHAIHDNRLIKKLCLMKFFMLVGLHPEIGTGSPLFKLMSVPIDEITNCEVVEAELDAWLLQCLHMHPHSSVFKTVRFVTNNRME